MTNAVTVIKWKEYCQPNSDEYYVRYWKIVRGLQIRYFVRERYLYSEEHLTVCYELHHVLLPELADAGLIKFDRVEDEVRPGTRFDEVRRFLGQINDDQMSDLNL